MAGLLSYPSSNKPVSAMVGYAILQAGKQGYLTDTTVQAATSADDLIALVNGAIVAPGAESYAQRLSIAKSIQEGINLGDLSTTRVQAATSVSDLAITYTWVSDDPAAATGHLGVGVFG